VQLNGRLTLHGKLARVEVLQAQADGIDKFAQLITQSALVKYTFGALESAIFNLFA
jgi:hypothetical protein